MQFIDIIKKKIDLAQEDKPVFIFKLTASKEYPALFFFMLLKRVAPSFAPQMLDMDNDAQAKATLETAFLGLSQTYWLGCIDALPKKKQTEWLAYIKQYQGPNKLLCATAEDDVKQTEQIGIIALPAKSDKKLFTHLVHYLSLDAKPIHQPFIDELFKRVDQLDFDAACLLIQYMQVLGVRTELFLEEWVPQLVVPERSLFQLSQYFFAKQMDAFLMHWQSLSKEYGEPFWIIFWSEQLWRAAFYCALMHEKKFAEAKKIGFRLPFSFMQKDYRNYRFEELLAAHDWLYRFDYGLKNGTDPKSLDLFFYTFFADRFAQSS